MVAVWKQLVQTEKDSCSPLLGRYHCASNIISNSHPFHSKWVDPPIPEKQQFEYFTMKIQGQAHGWGESLKSQCKCNILSTRIPFVPCQRALPFLRYSIFKIWPWKSKVNVIPEGHIVGTTPYQLISLPFDVDEPSHSYLLLLKNLTLKIQGQGQMTMMLHNYRSRQFLRTLNGINPSSSFRDMGSTKSGPSAVWFDKFLAHRQAHKGQMGK